MTSAAASTRPRHTGRSTVVSRQAPPSIPRPRRASGGWGRFGRTQLVVVEVAVVAVGLAVISGAMIAMIVTGVSALAVLLLGCGRSGGRWSYQVFAARTALRKRRSAAQNRQRDGHQPVDIQLHNHEDRGSLLGIGQDDRGWFAAVAVGGDDAMISPDPTPIPLDRLTRLLDEGSARPSALQIVTLRVSETDASPARSACAESYRELTQSLVGGAGGLAAELTWIAVRLDTSDALVATVERGGGLEGVAKALAAAIGRVVKLLAGAGITYRVLDGEALLDALQASCGFDPVATRGTGLGERWRDWLVGELAQRSFEVNDWPSQPAVGSLGQLMAAPADRLVVSVTLRPGDSQLRIGTIVRVMTSPPALTATCQRVTDHAARIGFRLRPLHGLHGPAILASAPTGGQPL